MSKLPATCAVCVDGRKGCLANGWWCFSTGDDIPCARGKLPKPLPDCPLRGGKR